MDLVQTKTAETQPKPGRVKKVKRAPNSFVKALKDMGYWQGGSLKPFPKKGSKEHQAVLEHISKSKSTQK